MLDSLEMWFLVAAFFITVIPAALLYYFLIRKGPLPPAPVQTIRVGDWDLHYKIEGTGKSILLIHGLGASLGCWDDLAPLLATEFKVISLDLPGFGRSTINHKLKYGLDDQTERIEAFLDALEVSECTLVGSSMGGNLALWMGKRHPKRFPNVVAIGPATHPKLVPWGAHRLGFLSLPLAFAFEKPLATWVHKRALGYPDRLKSDRVLRTMEVYRRKPGAFRNILSALSAISDPRLLDAIFESHTLLLYGAKDRIVPRWTMDELIPRLPDATFLVHPDGGHHLQEDEPEWVASQIRTFLKV